MPDDAVTSRDIRILRDILAATQDLRGRPDTLLVFEVLGQVSELLGGDGVSLQKQDPLSRTRSHAQRITQGTRVLYSADDIRAVDRDPRMATWWAHYWSSPFSLVDRTGQTTVTSVRSWYSARQWMSHPMNADVAGMAVADTLLVGYYTRSGAAPRLYVHREAGSVFGQRELLLGQLLAPHLRDFLWSLPDTSAARPRLTTRQTEVLRLVEAGLTNRQIGRVLGVSEGTIRKHLENAFRELHVSSRTAAVAASGVHRARAGEGTRSAS